MIQRHQGAKPCESSANKSSESSARLPPSSTGESIRIDTMKIRLQNYCSSTNENVGPRIKAPTPPTITPGFYGRVG
jgi:hypothetical protein